ncbi:MAG: heterodisulfide reductase subunit A [Archaeoglobales archaeon]|nr:MAG: heterodisulfide reductase subunit A [Archaeoglobales archaeon]
MNVDILVIGGGISGLTAAVEAAETGYSVALIEKNPYLGGRVAQLTKYFPKMCPPYCGLEIFLKRLKNCDIKVITNAKVKRVEGVAGNFNVFIEKMPRFVNENCTACGECEKVCLIERPSEFDFGLGKTKAIYLPHDMAYPYIYAIDPNACNKCGECVKVCRYNAIDLEDQPEEMTINAKAIIVATGYNPYDANKLETLGFENPDVITNMMMERLASPNGPTKGKILRLSDGKEPKVVAFAQCAGSRDENHLPYCSAICCLATMKHALYIREQIPDSKVYIFYIDVRAYGRYEDFLKRVEEDENIVFVRGKVAKVESRDGKVVVHAEDTLTGKRTEMEADLVVLAVGMQPTTAVERIEGLEYDDYGFVIEKEGIIPCGVARMPADVAMSNRDATGAVVKAIQVVRG